METIALIPTASEYTEGGDDAQVTAMLDGPASLNSTWQINTARMVEVTWHCNATEFAYMRTIARQNMARGGPPFLVTLILNGPVAAEYEAKFQPGHPKLTEVSGGTFVMKASMWAMPAPANQMPAWDRDTTVTYPEAPV